MGTLGTGLIVVGSLISLFYGIVLLIKAFQTSILWGIGCLILPIIGLIFIVVHWDVAKRPFLKSLIAIPIIVVGIILAPELLAGGDE